jgi:hypothetical protein
VGAEEVQQIMKGVLDMLQFVVLSHASGGVDDTAEMDGRPIRGVRRFHMETGPLRAMRNGIGLEVHDGKRLYILYAEPRCVSIFFRFSLRFPLTPIP